MPAFARFASLTQWPRLECVLALLAISEIRVLVSVRFVALGVGFAAPLDASAAYHLCCYPKASANRPAPKASANKARSASPASTTARSASTNPSAPTAKAPSSFSTATASSPVLPAPFPLSINNKSPSASLVDHSAPPAPIVPTSAPAAPMEPISTWVLPTRLVSIPVLRVL